MGTKWGEGRKPASQWDVEAAERKARAENNARGPNRRQSNTTRYRSRAN